MSQITIGDTGIEHILAIEINGAPWGVAERMLALSEADPLRDYWQYVQGGDSGWICRTVATDRGERLYPVQVVVDKDADTDALRSSLLMEAGKLISEGLLINPVIFAAKAATELERQKQVATKTDFERAMIGAAVVAGFITLAGASAPDQEATAEDLQNWLVDGTVNLVELYAHIRQHVLNNL